MHKSLEQFKLVRMKQLTSELSAFDRLKKKKIYNVVNTIAPSVSIGSSSFLHEKRKTIKSWMSWGNSARSKN